MHALIQSFMLNTRIRTLKHVPAITQFSILHQYLTSQFIDYCHQHIHSPLHSLPTISLLSSALHPVSFHPSSSGFG